MIKFCLNILGLWKLRILCSEIRGQNWTEKIRSCQITLGSITIIRIKFKQTLWNFLGKDNFKR